MSLPPGLASIYDTSAERGYTRAVALARNDHGVLFAALLVEPPAPSATHDPIDTQYLVIRRVDFAHVPLAAQTIKRYDAADSRDWLHLHGVLYAKDNGKYGTVAIEIIGADLVIALTMRVSGVRTNILLIERGLGV